MLNISFFPYPPKYRAFWRIIVLNCINDELKKYMNVLKPLLAAIILSLWMMTKTQMYWHEELKTVCVYSGDVGSRKK